ncbi:MAG: hypothetical protein EAZ51_05935 [Sphingobacteriales bacterium]|nr:MAG: hypothetical protein EAZ64_04845 [Sphingobacteriales bacterium]TAF80501.1 MAG: hypothetical protein EAZ51_05935 [Sphingobacteriales bacterium]
MNNNYKKFLLRNSVFSKVKNSFKFFLTTFATFLSLQSVLFAQITNVTLTPTNPQCAEYTNGSISVAVSGGTAPFSYLWNDGNTSGPVRANLTQGTYSVVVTDNLGATFPAQSTTLVDPLKLQAIGAGLGIVDVDCFGKSTGSIEVNIINAVPPINYKWTKNGALIGGNTNKLENLSAGVYKLIATDSRGCFAAPDFPITQPTEIMVNELPGTHVNNTDFGQNNGVIKLNVTGGVSGTNPTPTFTYLWNDGNTNKERLNLPSGTYTVTVTDNKGCFKVYESKILPLVIFDVQGTSVNNKCFASPNGSITITAKDGVPPYKFKWADQANFVTNPNRSGLSAGTYTLVAQDANGLGAIRNLNFTITEPPLLSFTKTFTSNKCFGETSGAISLDVAGGAPPYRYILNGVTSAPFSGNNVSIPNLASGSYTVSIIDNGGCPTPAQNVDILPLTALAFSSQPAPIPVRCDNDNSGGIVVTVVGGLPPYTYNWSNNPSNNTNENLNIPAGNYTLLVSDALGCQLPAYNVNVIREASPVTIVESTLPNTHINNDCFLNTDGTPQKNGKATIVISGGLAPFTATWLFENQPLPSPVDRNANPRLLAVDNLASGRYSVIISDNIGCQSTPLIIDIKPLKNIASNPMIENENCVDAANGTITVNPTGGTPFLPPSTSPYTYQWGPNIPLVQRNSPTVGPLAPGIYRLRIFDSNSCPLDTSFVILPAIPIEIGIDVIEKSNTCEGGSGNGVITVPISGGKPGYTYKWYKADPTTGEIIGNELPELPRNPALPNDVAYRDQLPAGNYKVVVTDANNCETELPEFVATGSIENTFLVEAVSCGSANSGIEPIPLMSPNGDGINDFFKIKDIEKFPDNQVIIYNRYGMEVFTRKRYNNTDRTFTGIANSAITNTDTNLVDGVYFYTIRTVQDKKPRLNKGYIVIKR